MLSTEKSERYFQLVEARKTCAACAGLTNPSTFHEGKFDSAQIGPWSRWQGNLNAAVMIVGQDWGDENYFKDNAGQEKPNNRTNETLRELLASVGLHIGLPSQESAGNGLLFFTNAILCLKKGGMQGKVNKEWFSNCGTRFLKLTIEIVQPRILITLGERAYHAVADSFDLQRLPFRSAVEQPHGINLPNCPTTLYPVYHCGARILNTHRKIHQQKQDWIKVERLPENQLVLRALQKP